MGVPQMLVLMQLPPESREFSTPRQLPHLTFEIAAQEFDGELERLRGLGFGPQVQRHLVIPLRAMCIKDPDGNEIQLVCKRAG